MKVIDFTKLAQASELKQLALADDKPAILGFINLGVLEIYKRFKLWYEEAVVTLVSGTSIYKLDGTDTNVTVDFSGHSLAMIDSCISESDVVIPINDPNDDYSISTPKYDRIRVPAGILEDAIAETLTISYKAFPLFLTNETQQIPLPSQFLEPLLHYIGYCGHGSIKEDAPSESSAHYRRFDDSCKRVAAFGLIAAEDLSSYKFIDRGFA